MKTNIHSPCCPLCKHTETAFFHQDSKRNYLQCPICYLVFVPHEQHLDSTQEKAIYDLHENLLEDNGYRKFLSRLAIAVLDRLPRPSSGLDYGCGPGPLLAKMLTDAGQRMQIYDPYYAPAPQLLAQQYDFVTASEVVEHFRNPEPEFQRLFNLLKPAGILAIMTKLVIDAEAFANWHYKNDLTHIIFFSRPTMYWLAGHYPAQLEFVGKDVIIFTKI